MCEIFTRLKQLGVVQGKQCILEAKCEIKDTPPDDRNPLIHCSVASLASMQETAMAELSAEDLIKLHESTQK